MQQYTLQMATIRKDRKEEQLPSDERSVYDVLVACYDKAVEQHLNSYEDACAKYLDRKIDTQRFKKSYTTEIRDLCEKTRGTIHKLLHPDTTSNYKAIWAVYKEWNNLEANPGG